MAEGASGIRARIAAWMRDHGVSGPAAALLMPSNVSLHRAEDAKVWREAMVAQLPEGVRLESARRTLGAAILVIHHTTKHGETERGTGALRNASFAMFKSDGQYPECDRMKRGAGTRALAINRLRLRCRTSART